MRPGLTRLDRVGVGLVLVLPLFLLHGRGLAEGVVGVLDALFLVQAVVRRDWAWRRPVWVRLAGAWWAWVVVCSVPHGWGAVGQAAGAGRFLLLVAALEHWALRDAWARAWLARVLRWSALYLAAQSLLQFATGRNLFGFPRGADGELTGPYQNPRAGAPLSRLLFPAAAPVVDRLMARGWPLAAFLLLPAAVGMVVLIGQRMPLLLTVMGLFVTALFLPQLRRVVLASCGLTLFLVVASSVVAPPTFNRLVTKFSAQMAHFPDSAYGQIAARAVRMAEAHPVVGVGFDGFRRDCTDPAYFRGWGGVGDDGGGAAMCVQHPHNAYLQALVEGGVPGLLLFGALSAAWLWRLLRGLWGDPVPLRVGLFVAALIHLWPVASSTAWTSMPLGGWFFVLLGLGLAEARPYIVYPAARGPVSRDVHV